MSRSSTLTSALAGGLGAIAGRLLMNGAWPASAGEWVGLLALGAVVSVGVYVALRIVARRRQP